MLPPFSTRTATPLVDEIIGTAFPTVRHVSENIEYVKHVSVNLPSIYNVYENIVDINNLNTNTAALLEAADRTEAAAIEIGEATAIVEAAQTAADVWLTNVVDYQLGPLVEAAQDAADAALENATGLVIATETQARQGDLNNKGMSPLRTNQAFDELYNNNFAKKIEPEFFGMHFNNAYSGANQTPYYNLGQGSVRLWDSGVRWFQIEPNTKGTFNWTVFDQLVNLAEAQGQEILYCLGHPPVWATSGVIGSGTSTGGSYNNSPPTSNADWVDYITAVATRYLGRIKAYEIWNEPNLLAFYGGTVARLAELTRLAYQTIKAIDPTAIVVTPSVTGDTGSTYGPDYLKLYLAENVIDYFDVVGIHLYVAPKQPEGCLDVTRQYRAIMKDFNIGDREIWNTEFTNHSFVDMYGNSLVSTYDSTPAERMPYAMAADYIIRLMVSSWAAGVSRSYFYGMDPWWSTIRMIDLTNKSVILPAGRAFKALSDFITGTRMVSFKRTNQGLFEAIFVTKEGNRRSIIWSQNYNQITFDATSKGISLVYVAGTDGTYSTKIEPESNTNVTVSGVIFCEHGTYNSVSYSEAGSNIDPISFTVTQNSYFKYRVGTLPVGWSTAVGSPTLILSPNTLKPTPDTLRFTPSKQYAQFRQILNKPLEKGLWKIWMDYAIDNTGDFKYLVIMETVNGFSGPIFWGLEGLKRLPATDGKFVRYEKTILVPDDNYDCSIKLNLSFDETSGFVPIDIAGFGIDCINSEPAQKEPYTRKLIYSATDTMNTGSFTVDDAILFNASSVITSSGYLGKICTTSGTLGTLTGVTADIASGSRNLNNVSPANALRVGSYVTFNGGSVNRVIKQSSSTSYQVDGNLAATATAASVAYFPPVFSYIGFSAKSSGAKLSVPSRIEVTDAVGTQREFSFATDGVRRASMVINTEAEAGSNAGSNFRFALYDDLGVFIKNAYQIRRDNGEIQINGDLKIPNNGLYWAGSWDKPFIAINGNRYMWTSTNDLYYKNNAAPTGSSDGQVVSRNISAIISGIDAPSLIAGANSSISTYTVVGAELGDYVKATMVLDTQGIKIEAWVSAADTIKYFFRNPTGTTIDLGSGSILIKIEKRINGV